MSYTIVTDGATLHIRASIADREELKVLVGKLQLMVDHPEQIIPLTTEKTDGQ